MARVYRGEPCGLSSLFGSVERLLYRLGGLQPTDEMNWRQYATACARRPCSLIIDIAVACASRRISCSRMGRFLLATMD